MSEKNAKAEPSPLPPNEQWLRDSRLEAAREKSAAKTEPVAVHDKDQPNGIAWCPGYPEKLADITALYAAHPAKAEPSEAELVCAEAYQVVGSLLSDLCKFNTPEAQKILDNLSARCRVHADVLPWPSYAKTEPVIGERALGKLLEQLLRGDLNGDNPEDLRLIQSARAEYAALLSRDAGQAEPVVENNPWKGLMS